MACEMYPGRCWIPGLLVGLTYSTADEEGIPASFLLAIITISVHG